MKFLRMALAPCASATGWAAARFVITPPPAAQAIASVMGETLLRAWSGQTFALSASPIWVRPLAVAVSVQPAAGAGPISFQESRWTN